MVMMRKRQYHIPRDEAIERFLDKSKTYEDDKFITQKDEVNLYYDLLGLGNADWDLWTVTYYSSAIGVIRYIKKTGHKVKVINKGNRVIILYKHMG